MCIRFISIMCMNIWCLRKKVCGHMRAAVWRMLPTRACLPRAELWYICCIISVSALKPEIYGNLNVLIHSAFKWANSYGMHISAKKLRNICNIRVRYWSITNIVQNHVAQNLYWTLNHKQVDLSSVILICFERNMMNL